MSFKNRWTIRGSFDFQAHQQHSQRRCCFSQTALLRFEVPPHMLLGLPGARMIVIGTQGLIASAPSYSEGRQECPPKVSYSPEIAVSKLTLHILSDTPGGFQWLKYILLMYLAIKSQMLNKSGVVKRLMVIQQLILEFDKYPVWEYILIISEYESSNLVYPVLFSLCM
jgi:hypothetical protein